MSREWTPKENFMAAVMGEIPQSVPYYNMGMPFPNGGEPTRSIAPDLFHDAHHGPQGGKDIWGVTYVANAETGYASLPEPNNFILDDITRWRDVIKAPEMPDVDWEQMAKADYEKAKIDRNVSAVLSSPGFGPFQTLVAFMGFTETLCALYEEPEECKALLEYLSDFYQPIVEKTLDYYKPDVLYLADDTASKYAPFFSPEIYKDIFKPIYKRMADAAINRGIPIGFHDCGKCEAFIPDMVDFGVRYWDPAQTENDLDRIKKEYQGRLAIVGGWEVHMFTDWTKLSKEELADSIRKTIDRYAPGGGYIFVGGLLGQAGDTYVTEMQKFIRATVFEYGDHYYEKH